MGRSLRVNAAVRMTVSRRRMASWLGCLGAQPWSAFAQRRGTIYRIGIVGLAPTVDIEGANPRSTQVAVLLRAMGQLGYAYGEHYVTLAHGVAGNPLGMDGWSGNWCARSPM